MGKRIVKLNESDLEKIVKRVIKENEFDVHSNSVDDSLKNYASFDKDSYSGVDLGKGFNEEQQRMFGNVIMDFIRQAQENIEDPYVQEIVIRMLINSNSIGQQKFRRR